MNQPSNDDPRWARMGLSTSEGKERVDELDESLELWGRYNDVFGPTSADNPTFESYDGRKHDLGITYEQIQLTHLEIAHPYAEIGELVRTGADLAVDLFNGDWRDNALLHSGKVWNREECRQNNTIWLDEFRKGLVVTLLNGDWGQVKDVASYIDVDLYPDEGAWNRTKQDRAFFMLFKRFACEGTIDGGLAEEISNARPRRPKLLLQLLESIKDGDTRDFAKPFTDLVKLFRKQELHDTARYVTSMDASFIWNLGAHLGVDLPDLKIDVMDHVITKESVGLDREK